ncbi:MAG: hypothetical protein N2606_03135 [Candidatus Omnitrophica bacterium]|nr:hypothetical protein [Candidatus Omnitrophota bacterium]
MRILLEKLNQLDKQKLIALGIALGIMLILDIFFVLGAQIKHAASCKAKIILTKRTIADIKRQAQQLSEKRLNDEGQQVTSRRIIDETELPLLLQEITLMAKTNNIKVGQIVHLKQPVATPKQQGSNKKTTDFQSQITPLLLKLDLVCGYHDFGIFLNALENSDKPFSCDEFKIMRKQDEFQKLRITLSLRTLIKPQ